MSEEVEEVITDINDLKCVPSDFEGNRISDLTDRPTEGDGLNAAGLKAYFDYIPINLLGYEKINGLIDFLASKEFAENVAFVLPDDSTSTMAEAIREKISTTNIKYIRINSDKVLETSQDGETWEATGSSGHIILNGEGAQLPQRARLKFTNTEVSDDGTATVITAIKGAKGDTGDTGAKGDKGDTGDTGATGSQGAQGYVLVPEVASNGDITWTISVSASVPTPMNIRGPQGVQGIQGVQGAAGVQGAQGSQGQQGIQGVKGDQGDPGAVGATGAVGPTGATGKAGPTGAKGDTGDTGPRGIQGIAGVQGAQGPQGERGNDGADGRSFTIQDIYPTLGELKLDYPNGNEYAYQVTAENDEIFIYSENAGDWESLGALQGPQGPQGEAGAQGAQGPQGETGAQGETGPAGPQGETGETGATGPQGPKGDTGATGPQGPQGITGPQGLTGADGIQGAQGVQGAAGQSAYQLAVNGGYEGTQADYETLLANIENNATTEQLNALKGTGWLPTETLHALSLLISGLSTNKADNTAVVKLTGDQTIAGVKAFSSKPTYGGSQFQTASDLSTAVATKAGKSATVTATLLATGWTGDEAPFLYNLTVSGVTTTSNQELLPSLTITAAQLEALQGANIVDAGQLANTVKLYAYGDKPTINIPIRIIKRGD